MTTATLKLSPTSAMVGMGQIVVAHGPNTLNCVLGSCVGVTLYHARSRVGVMAHVVLASSGGQTGSPGKFADTAIPRMIELLTAEGGMPQTAVAKIAGGASMFGASGPLKVGASNTEAVVEALRKAGLRLVAQHVGENKGRRVTFDCATGDLSIEIAGREPLVI